MATLFQSSTSVLKSTTTLLRPARVQLNPASARAFSSSPTFKMADCIFCKIIDGKIPSHTLYNSDKTFAFLDISPLSKGHSLVIPKHHGAKLTDIPPDNLSEVMSVLHKIAGASGAKDYNILQNNGRIAHQQVDHVHFHFIPKPNEQEGLTMDWPMQSADQEELKQLAADLKAKM